MSWIPQLVQQLNFVFPDRMDCMHGLTDVLQTEEIVKLAYQNEEEELNHRSIKEFMGTEHFSFNNFGMNGAYY